MCSDVPLLLQALSGQTTVRPPVWLMRQAGRYLPEYRALRATTPDFISFCLDPKKAAEATLQPMRRFPLDAAIVFADILLIPRALGQDVRFEAGEGPKLGPLPDVSVLERHIFDVAEALSPVGETLSRVRAALEPGRTLIGFAGAPWTVLTYMLGTRGEQARGIAYADLSGMARLLDLLVEATAAYLAMQVSAGAEVLVLFESWAEGLSEPLFEHLVLRPHQALLAKLRSAGVTAPVIGFPRGAGALVERYADRVDTQGVALDTQATAELGRHVQGRGRAIQGALDPWLLRAGGPGMLERVDQLIAQWRGGPHIFNLGHGVLPDTPVFHVEQVVARVTGQ